MIFRLLTTKTHYKNIPFISEENIKNRNMFIYIYIYIYAPPTGVEHSSEGIYGCHSHNAKLFEQIEHSGIW